MHTRIFFYQQDFIFSNKINFSTPSRTKKRVKFLSLDTTTIIIHGKTIKVPFEKRRLVAMSLSLPLSSQFGNRPIRCNNYHE